MRLLYKCAVALLLTAPLLSLCQTPLQCPKPVIPDSQKLDPNLVQQPKDTADLPSVIASVQAAMQCYQDHRGNGSNALPKLNSVSIDFKTTTGTVGGLSFSIFIIKIGGSVEKDTVSDLTLTYTAPAPSAPPRNVNFKATPPQQLSDALANQIFAAAKAAQLSHSVLGLPLNKISITVQFGIKIDGNASLSIPVELVTLGPNADRNRATTQSVTLTFGN